MATAVFGGSPRHHQNRILVNPNGSATNLQQERSSNPGNIIVPPSPYLSSPVSLHHYCHSGGGVGSNSGSGGYGSPTQPHHQQGFSGGGGHGFYQIAHSSNAHLPNPLYASQRNFKRKSAVELLAESKAYYVKSETVLDRHQQLYRSSNLGSSTYMASPSRTLSLAANAGVSASTSSLGGGGGGGGYHHSHHHPMANQLSHQQQSHSAMHLSQVQLPQAPTVMTMSATSTITPQQQQRAMANAAAVANRRSSSSSSDLLQNKLRKLLNTSDSKETITAELLMRESGKYGPPDMLMGHHSSTASNTPNTPGTFSYTSPKIHEELSIQSENHNDVSVFFPSAFLSPQSLPPHPVSDDDIYTYGIDDNLILTDDYRAISPPSEYAASDHNNGANMRYNYQRSYSHSQAMPSKDERSPVDYSPPPSYQISSSGNTTAANAGHNINSHKSLPDLHSQISRHSPLSCCSRGNRSNKSGSSFNRDSGGSSGHYTHRSEPNCCRQAALAQQQMQMQQQQQKEHHPAADIRRDSGSSTQHSGNSYYAYGIPPLRYDCPECRSKMKVEASECLLNFTTPEVPEAFQDDYEEKNHRRYYENVRRSSKQLTHGSHHYSQQQVQSPQQLQSPPGIGNENELSPPLGTFKRQKCLRFKHRGRFSSPSDDRRPILRSKSDISDRYWNKNVPLMDGMAAAAKAKEMRAKSESMSQLEHFFDRLGLNDEKYEEFIAPKPPACGQLSDEIDSDQSSPVFFSDVSTVDSNRLPDSTETQPQLTAQYRPNEPPSIVERNARIIKWLCNCRKVQLT